ncbi:hypothetical protein ES332_D01G240400v1 [Gossypium tomentosum]|uniref:Transmembrane protein n=1 Tax=Gossypium tomentosum TaxID=34277 RepID=A0A5D2MCS8_GOSTO|nr:hypothetical protein ES332_D01G240400v1 [Gossypium tomentosum]
MTLPFAMAKKSKTPIFSGFSTPRLKKHRFLSKSAPPPQKGTDMAAHVEEVARRASTVAACGGCLWLLLGFYFFVS